MVHGAHKAQCGMTESRYPSGTLLPFLFGVSLLKLNNRKKGTLIIRECNALRAPYFTAKSAFSSDLIGLAARKQRLSSIIQKY